MNKKLRSFLGLVSIAVGAGLVYSGSNGFFAAKADTASTSSDNATLIISLFVAGIFLIAVGVMVSLFLFASGREDK